MSGREANFLDKISLLDKIMQYKNIMASLSEI